MAFFARVLGDWRSFTVSFRFTFICDHDEQHNSINLPTLCEDITLLTLLNRFRRHIALEIVVRIEADIPFQASVLSPSTYGEDRSTSTPSQDLRVPRRVVPQVETPTHLMYKSLRCLCLSWCDFDDNIRSSDTP
jgi:hypothetical protein